MRSRRPRDADRRLDAGERAPLLGVPVAVKDDTDVAGQSTPFGCAGEFEPKARGRRGRPPAEGRRGGDRRQDDDPRARPVADHRGRVVWRDAQARGASSTRRAAHRAVQRRPSRPAWSRRRSGPTASARSASQPRGRTSWGSSRSEGASRPRRWSDAFNGLACVGPLARTVEDAALLLDAIAGNHPADLIARRPARRAVRRRRAAGGPGAAAADRAVVQGPLCAAFRCAWTAPSGGRVERARAGAGSMGHDVEHADPVYGVVGLGVLPRAIGGLRPWMDEDPRPLPARSAYARGGSAGSRFSEARDSARPRFERPASWQVGALFRRFDVLVTPTTARPPMPVGAIDGLTSWQTDQTNGRLLPVHVAVERARVARGERSGGLDRVTATPAPRRRPASRPGQLRAAPDLAAQLGARAGRALARTARAAG